MSELAFIEFCQQVPLQMCGAQGPEVLWLLVNSPFHPSDRMSKLLASHWWGFMLWGRVCWWAPLQLSLSPAPLVRTPTPILQRNHRPSGRVSPRSHNLSLHPSFASVLSPLQYGSSNLWQREKLPSPQRTSQAVTLSAMEASIFWLQTNRLLFMTWTQLSLRLPSHSPA